MRKCNTIVKLCVTSSSLHEFQIPRMLATTKNISFAVAVIIAMMTAVCGFSSTPISSSPIPTPPPISMPVWSFATASKIKTSMNIMTFCIPVSVSSPKLWALSFYHGTLTKDSFLGNSGKEGNDATPPDNNGTARSVGILQLLKFDHRKLVPILGKQSGRETDKSTLCSEEGFPWFRASVGSNNDEDHSDLLCAQDCDFELLPGCALYVQVEWDPSTTLADAGDHVVAICEVTRIGVWNKNDDETLEEGEIKWNQASDDNTSFFPLNGIDESHALYSGQLRTEGIL